jgi:chromate transporter
MSRTRQDGFVTGSSPTESSSEFGPAREVALVFLRLGVVAFGGPAAHIAMMRQELVQRRKWLTDERFVDLMGATNLIPGPNSTELAIHLGHERARWRGLLLAGVLFILPAAVMVTVLAWLYVESGDTPALDHVLRGVVPVVVAIVVWALVPLLRTVVRSWWLAVLVVAGLVAYLLGVNELVVLFGGAAVAVLVYVGRKAMASGRNAVALAALPVFSDPTAGQLATLFATMLKIGAVLYGSGYVLFAFLEGDFVDRLGWITHQQLLDAIAVGQVTPGPLFTSATFVGYLVAGLPGAFLATVAIFLPSFVFVGLLTRLAGWLRSRAWTSALLDAVNALSLALMVGVTWTLGREAIVDAWAVALFATTLLLLWRTRLNSAWYVAGGALAGILLGVAGW